MPKEEIDRDCGLGGRRAKEGNPKDAPQAADVCRRLGDGQAGRGGGNADGFAVPASGTVDYTYFVVPTGFTEDKWVENVEVRAGNHRWCTMWCSRCGLRE